MEPPGIEGKCCHIEEAPLLGHNIAGIRASCCHCGTGKLITFFTVIIITVPSLAASITLAYCIILWMDVIYLWIVNWLCSYGLNVKSSVADTWCLDGLCFDDFWVHIDHGLSQCKGSCMVRPMLHTSVEIILHSPLAQRSRGDCISRPSVQKSLKKL